MREEQLNEIEKQSKLAHNKIKIRTLTRHLNCVQLKSLPPDNSEQLAKAKWIQERQAKIESDVKAAVSYCIHCLDQPTTDSVEIQYKSEILKRVKERTPCVLERADKQQIPMETKEARVIAMDEIIEIIAEEERSRLNNQMNRELAQREQRLEEKKRQEDVAVIKAKARAIFHAARLVTLACRRWLARKELHRLCLDAYDKIFDEQSHTFYYLNKISGEASWVKPKAMGDFEMPAKDEWKLLRDAYNFPYYFNPGLMEMRWTPPCTEDMCCGIVAYTWWREYPVPVGPCPNFSCKISQEDGKRYCEDCL